MRTKNKFTVEAAAILAIMVLGASSINARAFDEADINQSPFEKEFKTLDANSNGTLSQTEAGNDELYDAKNFSAADIDNDGTLDQKEYADYKTAAQKKYAGRVVDDSVITSKVKAGLLKEDGFKGLQVKVKTYKGVVQLSGFVDSNAQITRAEEIAKSTEGVKSVKNGLSVKS